MSNRHNAALVIAIAVSMSFAGPARAESDAECNNDALKSECSAVYTIQTKYCDSADKLATSDYIFDYGVEKERDELIDKINGWPAAKKRYDAFHAKWKKCYGRENKSCRLEAADYAKCEKAPAALRTLVRNAVVEALRRHNLQEASKKVKSETTQAHHEAQEAKKAATVLLGMLAKIPKDYHAEKPALESLVAQADKILGAVGKADEEAIASRGCPKGSGALSAAHKKLVTAEFKGKESTIVRQTGAKRTWRTGLISKESIPAAVCGEQRDSGGKICRAWEIAVVREKPPGGAWASWALTMHGDYQINCARLR